MIDLKIGLDGVPSLRKLNIGNKYENNDEIINFILPSEFDNYNKYIIAVIKQDGEKITRVLPVVNNQFVVSTSITYIAGAWSMYLMCRENEIDIEAETIDISAKNGEHVFISDGFIGIVANSSIEKELVENAPIDTNLQLVYDDLLSLKNELIEKMNTPTSYNDLVDVPKEFKPISHNHDDRYYTEEEIDSIIKEHKHSDTYYDKRQIDQLLGEKSESDHLHDDRYYKKEEVDNSINNEISNRTEQYNELKDDVEQKISKEVSDRTTQYNTLNDKLGEKSNDGHKHVVNDITDFPTSMPANGGNSSTVNGHTVETDVPEGAVFTDTVYTHPETHPASMITGLPTKVSELENDKKYQTANEVAKAISDLIKLAPDTLNTLEELANALGNDPNFATTIMTMLGEKASKADLTTKVDIVAGKMLSSNDFTNELKTKLESLSNYDDSKLKALITSNQSALNTELAKKVTQIEGKQLSTNDYSTAEKNKLASLNNYDDSAIVKQLKELSDRVNGISMSITDLSVTNGVLKMSVDVQEGGK